MGLLSDKKIVRVSSVVYNLAGPLVDRPDYMKTTVARMVLGGQGKSSISEGLRMAQLEGPRTSQRAFLRWAKRNYPGGQLTGRLSNKRNVATGVVAQFIPEPAGYTREMYSAFLDTGEVGHWAERHILTNRRNQFNTAWTANYDRNRRLMVIRYADGTTEDVAVPGFDPEATYIIAHYALVREDTPEPWVSLGSTQDALARPSVIGWTESWSNPRTVTGITLQRRRTVVTDDGTNPPTSSTTTTENTVSRALEQTDYWREFFESTDTVTRARIFRQEAMYLREGYAIEVQRTETVSTTNGVTTTVIVEQDVVRARWNWRLEERNLRRWEIDPQNFVWIYRIGGANATLNALDVTTRQETDFFPIIPLRLNNKPVDDPAFAAKFPVWKKAFKRATGKRLEEMLENIADNDKVEDIDYAFLLHGVEVNTSDKAGLRYVYEFLRDLIPYQDAHVDDIPVWVEAAAEYERQKQAYYEWEQSFEGSGGGISTTPRPPIPVLVRPNLSILEQRAVDTDIPYRTMIRWGAIGERLVTGLGRAGARKGDLWWQYVGTTFIPGVPVEMTSGMYAGENALPLEHVRLFWQDTERSHRVLDIHGMKHFNAVYGVRSVGTTLKEAIESSEETGFILPLHAPTVNKLRITEANQLGLINRCIVFNCYEVVRVRWYQRGIFRIAFVIVIAVITALVFPGAGGLLGSNMALGTSLGMTGTAALVLGAVTNAIAAVALSSLIQMGATALFGEEFGALIGQILTVVAFSYVGSGSFALNWSAMLDPRNILQMIDAVTGTVAAWVNSKTQGLYEEAQDAYADYQDQSCRLQEQAVELLGTGGAAVDPLMFLDTGTNMAEAEGPETFLSRTLLTGGDVVSLSQGLIENYADLALTLPEMGS